MAAARIIRTYIGIIAATTLAQALIWGVNTLFLLDAGLDIFGVMVANAAFAAGMVLFEVPTGVVADTVGRRVSYLLCIGTLFVGTLLYVWFGTMQAGLAAFVGVSIFLGLGYTFFTGAVDAWMVDALAASGYSGRLEVVFSRGAMTQGAAMLVGTVIGGFLGQLDLSLPFVARAIVLVPAGLIAVLYMRDQGFVPTPLRVRRLGEETRKIAAAGVRYGWNDRVVRLLMLAGLVQGLFFMYGFYSWQVYFLDLLGRQLIWVNGVIAAMVGLAGIAGAALVAPLGRLRLGRPTIVMSTVAVQGVAIVMAAVFQVFWIAVPLYLVSTLAFGLQAPVRQAWLNAHIPSQQRATVISLDALFTDTGGAGGQVSLGYLSQAVSIPMAWIVGGVAQLAAVPLVGRARRREAQLARAMEQPSAPAGPDCARPLSGHGVC